MTQSELAQRAGISPSYLNLIEQRKRLVAGVLLDRIASGLGIDRGLLEGTSERRLVDEIREIAADPAVAQDAGPQTPAEEMVGRHRGWASLLVAIHRAYRQRNQDVVALADRLNRDPFLGESVHRILTKVASVRSAAEIVDTDDDLDPADRRRFLSIVASDSAELSRAAKALLDFFDNAQMRTNASTANEHVDAFLFEARNYFPELEDFAESRTGRRLADGLGDPGRTAVHASAEDAASPESVRFQRLRRDLAGIAGGEIEAILARDLANVGSEARALAAQALQSYAAGAILMPYGPFREAAERNRYDLDALSWQFGVSYEQAAHRAATLRRPGLEGPRFAFMRSDASGFITKRLPIPGLPLPRYGHACPLWVVYGAFQSPGVTVRAFGSLPSGEQFLFFARALDKGRASAGRPRHLLSVMLACPAFEADRVCAGDGLDRLKAMTPVGTNCRLCPRDGCRQRQEPRLIA